MNKDNRKSGSIIKTMPNLTKVPRKKNPDDAYQCPPIAFRGKNAVNTWPLNPFLKDEIMRKQDLEREKNALIRTRIIMSSKAKKGGENND